MIESETVLEKGSWKLEKMILVDGSVSSEDEGEEWWVLRNNITGGIRLSTPFDSVYATGGLMVFRRSGETTGVIKGILNGKNKYSPNEQAPNDEALPISFVEKLKRIGPW